MSEQAPRDVVLQVGDFHFGGGRTRIRTLLGSCVSITLWHPGLKVGGMCHYLLPYRGASEAAQTGGEGHYADGVMRLFMRELHRTGTQPSEYVVKLFGGGYMFCGPSGTVDGFAQGETADSRNISDQNVTASRELLAQCGFTVSAEHVGGYGSRVLMFEVWSGDVWVRRGRPLRTLGAMPCA